jgi:hypothetical protein
MSEIISMIFARYFPPNPVHRLKSFYSAKMFFSDGVTATAPDVANTLDELACDTIYYTLLPRTAGF